MSTDRDTARIVRSWLEEGVMALPDRVLDTVLDQLPATPQRRSSWPTRRFAQMNKFAQAAVAAAAVLVIAVLGYSLLPRTGGIGGQPISPTATPASTATPAAAPATSFGPWVLSQGALTAGTYFTNPLAAPDDSLRIVFTVPDGWQGSPPAAVFPTAGTEAPDGAAVAFFLVTQLYSDPCNAPPGSASIPAGDTVDDLVRALGEVRSSYDVGTPIDVTLGGYSGKRIDLVVPSDVDFATCVNEQYWIWEPGPTAQGPGNRWNIWILDVDGTRLVILGHDFPTTPPAVQAQLQDIVASVRIEP